MLYLAMVTVEETMSRRLNSEQRTVMILTAVALVGLLLLPPYYIEVPRLDVNGNVIGMAIVDSGIAFIGALPEYRYDSHYKATINIPYLIIAIVTILIASVLIVIAKGFNPTIDQGRSTPYR